MARFVTQYSMADFVDVEQVLKSNQATFHSLCKWCGVDVTPERELELWREAEADIIAWATKHNERVLEDVAAARRGVY